MITHASTTFPSRRSFSVHVEMISRGSYARSTRRSRTSSPTFSTARPRGRAAKRVRVRDPASPHRAEPDESHDRSKAEEEEPDHLDDGTESVRRRVAPDAEVRMPVQSDRDRPKDPIQEEDEEPHRAQGDAPARARVVVDGD